MIKLTAKPGLVKTNRLVVLPKISRSIYKKPLVSKVSITRATITPVDRTLKNIRVVQEEQRRVLQQPQLKPQAKPQIKQPSRQFQRRQIIAQPNKTKVKYNYRDISEDSRAKIKKLQGVGVGQILVIIANGPSVSEVDTSKLIRIPNVKLMSINKPDNRVWPTDYWLFCDHTQYRRHLDLWNNYENPIITSTSITANKTNSLQVKNLGGHGFSRDLLKGYHIGRSSVYAAMQVSMWMGFSHVYILGIDMSFVMVDGVKKLWNYGINPDVSPDNRLTRFDSEAKYYDNAASLLSDVERSKYTFCSGYLKYDFAAKFNKINHLDAVNTIIQHAQRISHV